VVTRPSNQQGPLGLKSAVDASRSARHTDALKRGALPEDQFSLVKVQGDDPPAAAGHTGQSSPSGLRLAQCKDGTDGRMEASVR